ncbi:MAG: DUF4956 domain-containing protein [Lachnospiraceae bacterium]|nr:DUF4956 domain-containing protein [Lachnospiraceae bacterium]
MNFSEIFNQTFMDGFTNTDIGLIEMIIVLGMSLVLGTYIFIVYRFISKQAFYSKQFNISLAVLPIIVAAIILAIQSSIVISLGMVGALSIVRFRTAVKDPLDLIFLFWSISVGIICGAGLSEISLMTSLIITVVILVLDNINMVRAPKLLVVNLKGIEKEEEVLLIVKKESKYCKVKSRNLSGEDVRMIIELRTNKEREMLIKLRNLTEVQGITLMEYTGESIC